MRAGFTNARAFGPHSHRGVGGPKIKKLDVDAFIVTFKLLHAKGSFKNAKAKVQLLVRCMNLHASSVT